jgi:hypothetical protein
VAGPLVWKRSWPYEPHAQVKDEMARFIAEVAPAFAGHA